MDLNILYGEKIKMSQTKVYDYLEKSGEATIQELSRKIGISRNNVEINLKKLIKRKDVKKLKRRRRMPRGYFQLLYTITKRSKK